MLECLYDSSCHLFPWMNAEMCEFETSLMKTTCPEGFPNPLSSHQFQSLRAVHSRHSRQFEEKWPISGLIISLTKKRDSLPFFFKFVWGIYLFPKSVTQTGFNTPLNKAKKFWPLPECANLPLCRKQKGNQSKIAKCGKSRNHFSHVGH